MDKELFLDRLTALDEGEMQMLRMMLEKPEGAILTVDTDIMLARLLSNEGLMELDDENKVMVPDDVREAFNDNWSDEVMLRWRKRNWMYKCIEAGKYLYGVMTWGALKDLFAIRYPSAEMDEIRDIFNTTPEFCQWFTERDGKLVLNGYERDDYYKYLEQQIQGDTPFYVPTREEVEELYNRGSLLSREAHARLKEFIEETYSCGAYAAEIKLHELYEAINNRIRINDAAESFAASEEGGKSFAFPSDEVHVKFIELLMDMSRECRVRDNRGHDWYEMTAIMAAKNKTEAERKKPVKRVKIGRNDPCPCGSGKKYKHCCGLS